MRPVRIAFVVVWALVLGLGLTLYAQTPLPPPDTDASLRSLAARASVVVAGEVVSVAPQADFVAITIAVDAVIAAAPQAAGARTMQGAQSLSAAPALVAVPGGVYIFREWSGLWAGGNRRYTVGERALFFLHAPSTPGGFSSPVDGLDGVVPLVGANGVLRADLRRLATRSVRAAGTPLEAAEALTLAEVQARLAPAQSDPQKIPLPHPPLPVVRGDAASAPAIARTPGGGFDGLR